MGMKAEIFQREKNQMKIKLVAAVVCAACLEWTRLSGTVKSVNLKDQTVTIENREGDLFTVPVDYQVRIKTKSEPDRLGMELKGLKLDDKITLTRIATEKPHDDTEGLVPLDTSHSGK